ncbi:hypothetical protein [Bacteroides thetaiotaomicron]|nr:hypothetical protein [Bacteroides thetaiotaomicron]
MEKTYRIRESYSETIAERIAEKVKSLADYMQYAMPSSHITDRTVVFS